MMIQRLRRRPPTRSLMILALRRTQRSIQRRRMMRTRPLLYPLLRVMLNNRRRRRWGLMILRRSLLRVGMIPRRITLLRERLLRRILLSLLPLRNPNPPSNPPHIQIIRTRRSTLYRLREPIPRSRSHPHIPIGHPTIARSSSKRTSSTRILIPISNPCVSSPSSRRGRGLRLVIPQPGLRVPRYPPLLLRLTPVKRQTNLPLLNRRTRQRIKI